MLRTSNSRSADDVRFLVSPILRKLSLQIKKSPVSHLYVKKYVLSEGNIVERERQNDFSYYDIAMYVSVKLNSGKYTAL